MAHEVFISYSHIDKAIADAICFSLEAQGTRCWYAPRDIEPGSIWAASIVDAINNSKVMVLVFTEDSNISDQVLCEVSNAVSAGLTIIPLKLTNQAPTDGMKYYLSSVHWLDALDCETEAAIAKVVEKVTAVLTSDTYVPPSPFDSKPAKDRRKFFSIAIAAILGLSLAFGGIYFALNHTDPDVAVATATDDALKIENPDNTYSQGNLQCNMVNGGIACSDDNYFYYRSNDNFYLYRMSKDGKNQEKLLSEPVMYLAAYDGYIYYYSQVSTPYIGKYELSSKRTEVLYTGRVENMRLYDDKIYFSNSSDKLLLYCMSLNGTELKCVTETENMYDYLIGDDCLYYINHDDGDKLYRLSMDGSKYQKLTDCSVSKMMICEDYIIYNNQDTDTLNALHLKKYKDYTICNGYFLSLTMSGYGITGVNQFGAIFLAKLGLNNLTPETLVDENVRECCQVDGFIFYRSDESGKYMAKSMSGGKVLSY